MDKVFVVKGVADKLWATENAIDAALAEASNLLVGLGQARRDLGLSATVDVKAVEKITAGIAALTEARSAICASHDELAEIKLRLGIRTRLMLGGKIRPTGELEVVQDERVAG